LEKGYPDIPYRVDKCEGMRCRGGSKKADSMTPQEVLPLRYGAFWLCIG